MPQVLKYVTIEAYRDLVALLLACLGMTIGVGLLIRENLWSMQIPLCFVLKKEGAGAGATKQVRVNERLRYRGGLSPPITGSLPHLPRRVHRNFQP
jgi:hypothetical protein